MSKSPHGSEKKEGHDYVAAWQPTVKWLFGLKILSIAKYFLSYYMISFLHQGMAQVCQKCFCIVSLEK
jgi:hypothetical protein